MIVFRLQKESHGSELSGGGAARAGTRWNSPGTGIIYTASNRSLAMAELVVHLPLGILPSGFFMLEIFIPDTIFVINIRENDLPLNWNVHPPLLITRHIGDDFVKENRYCLLKVPSAVTQGDINLLINPAHHEFEKIEILRKQLFPFDNRLFRTNYTSTE